MTTVRAVAGATLAVLGASAAFSTAASRSVESRHRPMGRMVPVDRGRLHVVDIGPRGPASAGTIVVLHGASGNLADMILALGAPLSTRYRVIAVDRPGHGWSDRPGGSADASPARQAWLIRTALEHLGVRRFIVVGHSWAGALAAHFALAHRDMVTGLVLVAGATHPWPGGVAWYYTSASTPIIADVFVRTLVTPIGFASIDAAVAAIFHPQKPVPFYAERIGARLLMRPRQFRANAEDMTGLHAFVTEQAPHYGEIAVPTGIISGTADEIVPDLHSKTVHGQIPHSQLTLLEGIGHMPHHVATDRVVETIDRVAARA